MKILSGTTVIVMPFPTVKRSRIGKSAAKCYRGYVNTPMHAVQRPNVSGLEKKSKKIFPA
jgi:hypothetical protein